MHLIGIRREEKNPFERRVPLTPAHVAELRTQEQVQVTLQPAPRRVFTDDEYLAAGAAISESLQACPVILGVKEIPESELLACKTYVFFSHTIKGQPHNMPMLRRLCELGCTLVDYERIVDDAGRRLVFFGRFAGLTGMIDTLWALGQRLALEGIPTPFSAIQQAYRYADLAAAKQAVRLVGREIAKSGVDPRLGPFVAGFAGYGNVSQGAQEIFDLLDPLALEPDALADPRALDPRRLYKVVFREEHLVERRSGSFELGHYYAHPEEYRPVFAARHLEALTLLVNGIFWAERYPRLVTLDDLGRLYGAGQPRLRVIGDISCDVGGSIEATVMTTSPDAPVFVYDLDARQATPGVSGRGPVILAVDNLPAELPRDASAFFSDTLRPFIPSLARADSSAPLEQSGLPPVLQRATIVYRGALTEAYAYLNRHL